MDNLSRDPDAKGTPMPPTHHSVSPEDKSAKQQSPKPSQPALTPNAAPLVQRESMDISRLQPNQVLSLQRSIGNRAVQNLVAGSRSAPVIQAKLEVGPVGDRYEQEADRIAAQVVKGASTPQPTPQANVQREEVDAIQRDDLEEDEEEISE
jgi:hypothetical protein